MRHINAAIRHLNRGNDVEEDACTDAIYRTNQAFEGSLKEAYRVLAKKDPTGISPFKIEEYLEGHNLIRPRVLKQLTRYRTDYRNPSTHDHKLDFDEDEALLAIVSVCAFSKLLLDQISASLAFSIAIDNPIELVQQLKFDKSPEDNSGFNFVKFLKTFTKDFLELESSKDINESEFDGYLMGYLSSVGTEIDNGFLPDSEDQFPDWDFLALKGDERIPFDMRYGVRSASSIMQISASFLENLTREGMKEGIAVFRDGKSDKYIEREIISPDGNRVHILFPDAKLLSKRKALL